MMEDDGGMDRSVLLIGSIIFTLYMASFEKTNVNVIISAISLLFMGFLLLKRIDLMKVMLAPQVELVKTDIENIKKELNRGKNNE
jgi:hypothetical protein